MNELQLMCGDCLELMKTIPDKSVDMILCDPPYGVTANEKDKSIPFSPLWEEYNRITKDNAAIVLFAQGNFYIDLVNSNRKFFRYDLVWDKQLTSGFLNAKRMPLRKHEQIAVFYRRLPTYNPQFSQGRPLHGKGKAYVNKPLVNNNYVEFHHSNECRQGSTEKYPTSILSFQKPHPSVAQHRTEKPVDLLANLIKTYTNPGEVVMDNCMGSGSVGVACVNTGRKFIGIEIDNEIFDSAVKRISKAQEEVTA